MIRNVEPLNAKQWTWLMDLMKNGPSDDDIKKMDEIGERIKKLRPLKE